MKSTFYQAPVDSRSCLPAAPQEGDAHWVRQEDDIVVWTGTEWVTFQEYADLCTADGSFM